MAGILFGRTGTPSAIIERHPNRDRAGNRWRALARRTVSQQLHGVFYCGCDAYLQKMVAGAQRVGLDGLPAGPVSETEAEQAARKLCGYAQRRAERAVERQQMAEVEPAKGGRGKKGGISEAARKAGLTRRTAQRRMTETKPAQNTKSGQVSCPATTEPKPQPTAEPKSPALFEAPKEIATASLALDDLRNQTETHRHGRNSKASRHSGFSAEMILKQSDLIAIADRVRDSLQEICFDTELNSMVRMEDVLPESRNRTSVGEDGGNIRH